MRAQAKIDAGQIGAMSLTISLTMTVDEWRELMRQQDSKWPSSALGVRIARVLGHITRATDMDFTDPLHET